MRVAIRLGRRSSGGMDALVERLTRALKELDQVSLVAHVCLGSAPKDSSADLAVEFNTRNGGDEYRRDMFDVGDWCSSNGIDLLICPGNIVSRSKCRVIWWPLTVGPLEPMATSAMATTTAAKLRWAMIRRALGASARRSDGIVFSSNYARQLYRATFDLEACPSAVILPAPSIDLIAAKPTQPPKLLYVSTFNRYKFVNEIVRAFGASELKDDGWALQLVGHFPDPAYEAEVRSICEAWSRPGAVLFSGRQSPSELPSIYSEASAFVFASISENAASYALIDALNYGLPIISSFYSSIPEITGNAALYFDPFDLSSILGVLNDLAEPSARLSLAEAATERRLNLNDWSGIANDLVEFSLSIN